jgi:dTDP-4-amino-4,6-dideoxygalactose transaminase
MDTINYLKEISRKCSWYPPAETKIPIPLLFSSLVPFKADFVKELCKYFGVDQCVCAESGRALLTLVLQALSKRDGMQRDEVLIPGYTCYSVAASVVRAGLKIRLYDINPVTFHPDLDSAKSGANEKTLAIVAQHLFGIPSPVDGLKDLAKGVGAYVIEDAAQALGGSFKGCKLGTMGDFGFYSFGRGKPLPLGCGGTLIGKDKGVMSDIILPENGMGYIQFLITAFIQIFSHKNFYGLMEALPLGLGETIFDPEFAISSMPLIMERLGRRAIDSLESLNTHRRTIAGIYADMFDHQGTIPVSEGAYPIHTRFPIMVGLSTLPGRLLRFGIRRMYPKALADEPPIRKFITGGTARTPGSSMIAERLITLPTHTGISTDLAKTIALQIKGEFKLLS